MFESLIAGTARVQPDGLIESVFDLRFEHDEIPEIVAGKLSTIANGWQIERMPMADIPAPIRRADPNMAYAPLLQLTKGNRQISLGERGISHHIIRPYPGWPIFREEIQKTVEFVLSNLANARVTRLGLRYINAMSRSAHGISIEDGTALNLEVAGRTISEKLNFNYMLRNDDHLKMVRIATPEFVAGAQEPFDVLIDVDVFTPDGFSSADIEDVTGWTEKAHLYVKEEFFGLIRPEALAKLVVEK